MKNINYILVILACALLALSATSCKDNKNDDDEVYENYYTFDGTTYPILSAGIKDQGGGQFGFIFSRIVITDKFKDEPESYLCFVINEEIFGEATSVFRSLELHDYLIDIHYLVDNAKSGTIRVVKDGDNYTLDFDMTFDYNSGTEHRLTGHYSGPMVIMPSALF